MAVQPDRNFAPKRAPDHQRFARQVSRYSWVHLYALLPFTLICVYYLIIFLVGFELAEQVGATVTQLLAARTAVAIAIQVALFLSLSAVLALLLWHLSIAVLGLLTQVHDEAPEASAGVPLSKDESPEVFSTVAEVGARIGAHLPDEVRVTYLPECYAAEIRWFAVRTRRRLVLVLGLPHIAVLTVGELKVVLAHELAHFSGDTRLMVFTYRFLRTLRNTISSHSGRWRRFVDPCYWYTWAYYQMMFALTGPVIRQQELKSDRASAAFYGGELAAQTMLKEWLVTQQFDTALATFPHEHAEGETIFTWFDRSHRAFSPDGVDYLEQRLTELESPSIWDSHPPMRKRLSAVRRFENAEDEDPRPARVLIPDYKNLMIDLHEKAMLDLNATVSFPQENDDANGE